MSKKFKLTGLEVVEGTICDQPMNPEAKVMLFKRRPAQEDPMNKGKQKTKKNAPGEGENTDPLKAMGLTPEQEEAVRQMLEEEKAKAAKAEDGEEEEAAEEEAEKAADPVDDEQVGKAVAKAIAQATADLQKQLAKERSLREEREYLEKARDYPSIPVQPEKIGSLMRVVDGVSKADGDTLRQVLKACHELASTNSQITKSLGKANGLEGGGRSASEEIDEVASSLMKADPKIDRSTAISKAWATRPDLVEKHRKETGGR